LINIIENLQEKVDNLQIQLQKKREILPLIQTFTKKSEQWNLNLKILKKNKKKHLILIGEKFRRN